MRIPFLAALFLLGTLCGMPRAAHAAQSYDNCTGFIDSVPAVISTQGTWCLRKDLATNLTSGNAIDIRTNNVVVDCNDFKLGGLAGGLSTNMWGIHASGRQNIKVRHCNIRGFVVGIQLDTSSGGVSSGHLVEDNRLDGNLSGGIVVLGGKSLVRRNRVYDTGGSPGRDAAEAINADADIEDNIVDGVASATGKYAIGIRIQSAGGRVARNHISGLAATDEANGIDVSDQNISVIDNHIVADGDLVPGKGIYGNVSTFCGGNTVAGFVTSISACQGIGGNDSL